MEKINKFKLFTIVIICTFLFVIAAIYTNTKDVTNQVTQQNGETVQYSENYKADFGAEVQDSIQKEFENVHQRIDELSRKVNNKSASGGSELKCRIKGTSGSRGIEEMSPSAAIQDAQINNNDLVILCSF